MCMYSLYVLMAQDVGFLPLLFIIGKMENMCLYNIMDFVTKDDYSMHDASRRRPANSGKEMKE